MSEKFVVIDEWFDDEGNAHRNDKCVVRELSKQSKANKRFNEHYRVFVEVKK